ncbi:GNAT family N-acetyltransferase [Nakamurella aerolata]|uniref:GNAT family N-acetyltransferase n=1 Tax=Nakamurella aerolata TaxID=1656892 RepID=A0A849A6R1_9ACTN|nr:GNAT family N-acetyltransferase [Nakamurella aerolata]NNG35143.1 GNAT family N-acetyltransferase [Nakamurella aerolata]
MTTSETAPRNLQIRPERPADAEAVATVIRAAFGAEGDEVAAIWAEITAGELPHQGLVAVTADPGDGERLVGHVGISHAWLDARKELVDITVLSPLAVLPELQNNGIGTALIAAATEAAIADTPMLVLEGSPKYYGARGFAPARVHGILPASDRTPGPAFQVVFGPGHRDWMTGRVIYPDVWWRHNSAGLRDPLLAELEQAFAQLPG